MYFALFYYIDLHNLLNVFSCQARLEMWITGFLFSTEQKVTNSSLATWTSKYSIIKFSLLQLIFLPGFQNVLKHVYSAFGRLKFHLSFLYAYSFLFDYFGWQISESRLSDLLYAL